MLQIKVKLNGVTDIILHNNQSVNPFNKYALALKEITKKRKKTEDDLKLMARIEWEAGLYFNKQGKIIIPDKCIKGMLIDAGKLSKQGTLVKRGVVVGELGIEGSILNYGNKDEDKIKIGSIDQIPNPGLDKYFERYMDGRIVTVQRASIFRVRPKFNNWSLVSKVTFCEEMIDLRTIKSLFEVGGQFIGLCDYRPEFGKFLPEFY